MLYQHDVKSRITLAYTALSHPNILYYTLLFHLKSSIILPTPWRTRPTMTIRDMCRCRKAIAATRKGGKGWTNPILSPKMSFICLNRRSNKAQVNTYRKITTKLCYCKWSFSDTKYHFSVCLRQKDLQYILSTFDTGSKWWIRVLSWIMSLLDFFCGGCAKNLPKVRGKYFA